MKSSSFTGLLFLGTMKADSKPLQEGATLMKLDRKSKRLIKDLYRGREHIELTVGILKDGETEVVHWGPDHKVVEGPEVVYAVGSICKPFATRSSARSTRNLTAAWPGGSTGKTRSAGTPALRARSAAGSA